MAKHKILKQKVYHDGTSMVVLKAGDRKEVPDRLLQTFIDEGVIEGKTSKQMAREAAERGDEDDDDETDAPIFTTKHIAGGLYEITGPGLAEPERVKGRTETEVRVAELTEAYKAANPAIDGSGAPLV